MHEQPSVLERCLLRLGKISYTNVIPFYHGLMKEEYPFEVDCYEAYPTKINLAMRRKKIDIAPVSSLEYLNHQKDYFLLPDLAVGSRDFSGSVLLLARERIEGLHKARIALSRESLSSAAMLRILLKCRYKFSNQYLLMDSEPEAMLKKNDAALVIGDTALFYEPKEFVYKYDLSELWWNWTEKPFCFALWAVRRDFAAARPKEVSYFYRRLVKNLDRNLSNLETLLKEARQLTFIDKRFPQIFGYLFNLSYGLDPSMREGLELFFRMAHRLGMSPRPRPFEFFEVKE